MANETTKVGTSRLKDFELLTNQIGCYVPSSLPEPPIGMLRVSSPGLEAKKSDWPELYAKIGGEDGSTDEFFILPYVPKIDDLEFYLVGKIIFSNTIVSGNTVTQSFTSTDLDSQGYYKFSHGISHLNPIIQISDSSGGFVLPVEIINSVGLSKIKIGSMTGTWKVTAIG